MTSPSSENVNAFTSLPAGVTRMERVARHGGAVVQGGKGNGVPGRGWVRQDVGRPVRGQRGSVRGRRGYGRPRPGAAGAGARGGSGGRGTAGGADQGRHARLRS